jgi:hypothetical protein
MSEPGSKPPKKPLVERSRLFESINAVAISQRVEPDPLALKDEADLAKDYPEALSSIQQARDAAEIEKLGEGTRQEKRVNKTRLIVLGSLFFLIVAWILSVILLTIALGFRWRGFWLPDLVMITYITTTTASVFGLFHIAAKWLFPRKKDD